MPSGPLSAEAHAGLAAFLAEAAGGRTGTPAAVALFHAVRRLPYLSTGDRSLDSVLARRAGSCSGKHILLAALLQAVGLPARVELVLGDFASPLKAARNIPETFRAAAEAGIRDVHNVVRAEIDGRSVLLDATWHDAVKPYGFRVNDAWRGEGDTAIAVDVEAMLGPAADPAAAKAAIIESWPAVVQAGRREFLEQINGWVARLERRDAA